MSTLTLNGNGNHAPALEDEDSLEPGLAFDEPDDDALTGGDADAAGADDEDEDDDDAFAPSLNMAQLAGYDVSGEVQALPVSLPDSESVSEPEADAAVGRSASLDLDEEDEEEALDPRTVPTKHGLIGSPITKLVVVGAGSLVVMLAIGAFLSTVMGDRSSKSPVIAAASPSASSSPSATPGDAQADEVAKYKTDSALTRQKELLNGASSPKPLPTGKAAPVVSPTPIPLSAPVAMPAAPVTTLMATPLTAPLPAPLDPMEKWRMAATMGSYGTVLAGSGGSNYSAPSVPATTVPVVPFVPVTPVAPGGARSLTQLRASSSTPGLRDRPLAAVLVGSTATAQTTTGVVMTGDNTTPVAPDSPTAVKYLAQLKVGLNDATGAVAIPAGSTLVMVARSFSPQTGLAEFVVSSVLIDNKEYTVPKDALVVRGPDGGLVAFNKRSGSGGGLFNSILPAFFAGVSQAGQILNQPTSSSSVSGGNVSATTSSSNPQPLAGFAQGFGMNLSQSLQQKAQAANQAAASAPSSWQLGAGTEVKVFVNASFEM